MQLTFLNLIVITSAFDNINLLSNSNDIYLHPSKLKPRADRRNIVGSCCVRLHVAESLIGFKLCTTTPNNMQQQATARVCKRTQRVTSVVKYLRMFSSLKFIFLFH